MSPNPMVRIRVKDETMIRIARLSLNFSVAEGGSVDHNEVQRRALYVGLRAIESCAACSSSIPCALHGSESPSLFSAAQVEPESDPWGLTPPGAAPIDPPVSDNARLVACYFETFNSARGTKPAYGAREGKAIKDLLSALGLSAAMQAIKGAYSDPFWKDKATILTIAKDPSRHLKGSEVAQASFRRANEVKG